MQGNNQGLPRGSRCLYWITEYQSTGPSLFKTCPTLEWPQYGCPDSFLLILLFCKYRVFTVSAHCIWHGAQRFKQQKRQSPCQEGIHKKIIGDTQINKHRSTGSSLIDRNFRRQWRHKRVAPNSTWRFRDLPHIKVKLWYYWIIKKGS